MLQDRFSTIHQTSSAAAVAAFGEAVSRIAAHRPSAAEALERALAADPQLVAGHALRGIAAVMLARGELAPAARRSHADALAARLAKGGATAGERALTDALGLCIEGRLRAAADRLDAHLDESPREFLHAKIAHGLRFMSGDVDGMLLGTARVIDAWDEDAPGYGFMLGCHAFALEEKGELDAAERIGRRAVELEPTDAWGLHAVSHVHEMQGRVDEGIAWIEAQRPVWSACNNFSFHMAWHLALFHLERGDHARVLDLYDAEVRPVRTDDFRDMANAVSLLWRLGQEGVGVGSRWAELRDIAAQRQVDTTLAFACLHNILALVAGGEMRAARELAGTMSRTAARRCVTVAAPESDQRRVLDAIACDLAQVILSLDAADHRDLGALAGRVEMVGGSHAQRDVFLRMLAKAAADRGDGWACEQVLSVRRRIKRDDRFAGEIRARLAAPSAVTRLSA